MNRRDRAKRWLEFAGGNPWRALLMAADDFADASSKAYLRTQFMYGQAEEEPRRTSIDDDEAWLKTGQVHDTIEIGPD